MSRMQTLEVVRHIDIAAPADIVFACMLEQLGPLGEDPYRAPMPLVLEPWPGGRWYQDFGNNTGHFWGVVQSILPNELLEIHGPMFMQSPVISHVICRLTESKGTTRVQLTHRAIGQIPPEHQDGVEVNKGWTNFMDRLTELAHRKATR
jgi:uncharacterized protein YndB with AHSA1/START domain